MKLVLWNDQSLTTSVTVSREDDPLEILAEWSEPWQTAELHDDRRVCWKRAAFERNGVGWKYTMDRAGEHGQRPEETERARDLGGDLSLVLVHLARRERVSRGRPIELPDWPAVVRGLVAGGFIEVLAEGGKLTRLGRAIAYELIDQGY